MGPQLITALSRARGYGEKPGGEGLFSWCKTSESLTHRYAVPLSRKGLTLGHT